MYYNYQFELAADLRNMERDCSMMSPSKEARKGYNQKYISESIWRQASFRSTKKTDKFEI